MNKTHFSFHKERKNKKKNYLSIQSTHLLFTPVSDCLDPGQDPHPVGPDRVTYKYDKAYHKDRSNKLGKQHCTNKINVQDSTSCKSIWDN